MKVGIIGYGSMGKMLLWKFSESGKVKHGDLLISNRTRSKIEEAPGRYVICESNTALARSSDILFLCLRPNDLLSVLEETAGAVREDTLIVSLNGSITFEKLEKIMSRSYA